VPEEKVEIPPGYALAGQRKMMGASTQLPRFGRQESMFRQARGFEPIPGSSLGAVKLRMPMRGGAFDRPSFVGQSLAPVEPSPVLSQAPIQTPVTPVAPHTPPAPPTDQGVPRHPAIRIPRGKLTKADAQQLADLLAQVLQRMKDHGVSMETVAKIQARLSAFVSNAQGTDTLEITEPEVQQMETEILALEAAEAESLKDGATPWIVATAAAIGLGLLINWLSD
jgi:hypothetical protein